MFQFKKHHIINTLIILILIIGFGASAKHCHAALLTQDIGIITPGSTFSGTATGQFTHEYSLFMPVNDQTGTAAITAHCNSDGKQCPYIVFTNVTLTDVISDYTRKLSINNNTFVGIWQNLKSGYYRLDVEGYVNPLNQTASYTGNWTITTPSAVPLPPSIFLFAASAIGLLKLNRKK